jgi:hypothetical protein
LLQILEPATISAAKAKLQEGVTSGPRKKLTMSQPGPESRRWTRHNIDVRLKVSLETGGNNDPAFGRGSTLSEGGMGAYIPCALEIGSTLEVEMSFPYTSNEVTLKAVVKTCEGFRYGLEFVNVPEHVRAQIMKNCDSAPLQ